MLGTDQRWDHDYECSSPDVFRLFRMSVFPVDRAFLVVTSSLRVERPHDLVALPADDLQYVRDAVITMCGNCRRVRAANAERWDWVPDYVRRMPPNTSHGLCPPCASTYAHG